MDPRNYDVIFNLAQHPYVGWLSASFPLIFVAIGVGAITMGERASTRWMGGFFVVFASVLTVVGQLGAWQQYQRLQRDFHEGQFSDVEGRVENFQSDRKTETFYVGGHRFYILKPMVTAAYSGGASLDRLCVRIFYTDREEIIWLAARKSGCTPMEALQQNPQPMRLWDP